jgi:hypothetical protein
MGWAALGQERQPLQDAVGLVPLWPPGWSQSSPDSETDRWWPSLPVRSGLLLAGLPVVIDVESTRQR